VSAACSLPGCCWRSAARPAAATEAAESSVTALDTYSYGQFKLDQHYGPMHVPSLPLHAAGLPDRCARRRAPGRCWRSAVSTTAWRSCSRRPAAALRPRRAWPATPTGCARWRSGAAPVRAAARAVPWRLLHGRLCLLSAGIQAVVRTRSTAVLCHLSAGCEPDSSRLMTAAPWPHLQDSGWCKACSHA